MTDLQNLRDIIQKTNPSLEEVQKASMKTLDDLSAALLNSRMVRQAFVIPSVVKAAQNFAGIPEGQWSISNFVYRATLKNLSNSASALSKAWPQLDQAQVLESIKVGARAWVEKVILENAEKAQ